MSDGKYQVCPACDGEGYVSSMGAFTSADVDEWFGDDNDEREAFGREYTRRGGAYDETCKACKGARVITVQELSHYEELMRDLAEMAAESRYC